MEGEIEIENRAITLSSSLQHSALRVVYRKGLTRRQGDPCRRQEIEGDSIKGGSMLRHQPFRRVSPFLEDDTARECWRLLLNVMARFSISISPSIASGRIVHSWNTLPSYIPTTYSGYLQDFAGESRMSLGSF
ncbi:hypothetical protein CEXT_559401 [Caerostris extrusa]|uniref:Uncharacterized protein n=1 Tax=Caerostris extrusa TaxID=172846 RepID=A0AAV4S6T2_CAEEX|nr:hypothetical protein CEXT_559401 [Caerostris extrusa]